MGVHIRSGRGLVGHQLHAIYKTQAERDHLAAVFGANRASAALFGPALRLQTLAGFTVFKSFMTLIVIGAVWGLLDEYPAPERRGRCGSLGIVPGRPDHSSTSGGPGSRRSSGRRRHPLADYRHYFGPHGPVLERRHRARAILFFSIAQVATPVMFLAVGALTSQLAPTRRQAATYAGWFLGLSMPSGWSPTAASGPLAHLGLTPRVGGAASAPHFTSTTRPLAHSYFFRFDGYFCRSVGCRPGRRGRHRGGPRRR